jgi:signal recognition particle receptor subunit beta
MIWNAADNEFIIKVVFIGPHGSGKRTNLEQLSGQKRHAGRSIAMPPSILEGSVNPDLTVQRREPAEDSIDACSFVPLHFKMPGGPSFRFLVFSVHSESEKNQSRTLDAADAFILVISSELTALDSNIRAMEKLKTITKNYEGGSAPPTVLQLNKRDLSEILSVDDLLVCLEWSQEYIESIASSGVGIRETLMAVLKKLDLSAAKQL